MKFRLEVWPDDGTGWVAVSDITRLVENKVVPLEAKIVSIDDDVAILEWFSDE